MALKLSVAPALEPVSLAEAVLHLRVESSDFDDNISSEQCIAPGSHVAAAAYSLLGNTIDVLGYSVVVNFESGTNGSGGTVDIKLQHSDNGTTWTDVTSGAFTQVTTANDNATFEKAYTGGKRYLRVVCTVANAACEFAVSVIKYASTSVEDSLITSLIKAARMDCEKFQNRAYIEQTWEFWLDAFPCEDYIKMPLPPLMEPEITAGSFVSGTVYRILTVGNTNFVAIGAASNTVGVVFTASGAGSGTGTATASVIIKYYGTDNTVYYMDAGDYFVDKESEPGRVALAYGKSWPSTTLRPVNGVCITFKAGYGDEAADVPDNIKAAIKLLIGHYYETREAATAAAAAGSTDVKSIPYGVEHLLWKDRVF